MNITKQRIVAADELDEFSDVEITEDIDNIADQITDVQDSLDDVDEDDIDIEIENNITGHYIAECDTCHGIFISAMIESDQVVSKISGICPVCGKETEQYLNWIVRDADLDEEAEIEEIGYSNRDDGTLPATEVNAPDNNFEED